MIHEAAIKAAIRSAPTCGRRLTELKDGGGRGEGRLALWVRYASNRVSSEWYAVWWRDGKRKASKLGAYPTMSLADARKEFRERFAPEISAGRDPTGSRARKVRQGVTVEDLFVGYVRQLKAEGKPSWTFAERALLGVQALAKLDGETLPRSRRPPMASKPAIESLGRKTRAADVRASDIRAHLAEIHERGSIVMASAARTYIHSAFAWAMKSANSYTSAVGLVNWGIEFNPVDAIPSDPEANRAGERHLTPSELRAFWTWATPERSALSPCARLIMATGQRVTEILQLTDPAYDRPEKMLDWSKTKNGMPHAIPLPRQAVTELDALVPNRWGVLFPHQVRPDEPATVGALEKMIRIFCEETGTPHFTPRDLRRTWKTLSGAAGLSKEIRDRMQNHARSDVSSRHYDRYDYLAEKRAAMEAWEAYLDRILSGELDNPVTRLDDVRRI